MQHQPSGRLRLGTIMVGILLTATLWIGRGNWFGVALAQEAGKTARRTLVIDRAPVRTIEDANPVFSGIAMDGERGEVFISNNNKGSIPSILVYPTDFQPTDRIMEPRRRIAGLKARLGDICGLAVSPQNKEIYTVQGEERAIKVFPLVLVSKMVLSQPEEKKEGSRAGEARQTKGTLAI